MARLFFVTLASLMACLLPLFAIAQTSEFEGDEKLQENARKWAEEFIVFAEKQYDVTLDWSHVSIKYLDDIANNLHAAYLKETPAEEEIVPVARALGSYVAEVYRIFYGGSWGWTTSETGSFPSVQSKNGAIFLPLAKALDRVKTGSDPDIWEYYQLISTQ